MGRKWYYSHDGTQRFGPVSTSRLRELARSGALLPVSMVLLEGGKRWVQAGTVKGLFPGTDAVPARRAPAESAPGAPAENQGSSSGALTICLTVAALLLLSGIVAWLVYPAFSGPRPVAVVPSTAPAGSTEAAHGDSKEEPPDPELFENPPADFRGLPKAEQARQQQKSEATYLNPAAGDQDHIAAANVLLGLPDGHTSLLKGLDVYDRTGQRRRYRWCLQYLRIAQDKLDRVRSPRPGQPSGIIPAKHVAAMVELLRGLDPKKPPERSQWATTLDYLEQHPEGAGPVVPVLRDLLQRHENDADLAKELRSALAAAEKAR
jgi:hypothetical protein